MDFNEDNNKLIIDDVVKEVHRGDTAITKGGMKHVIKCNTELHVIGVQIGDGLTEEDIEIKLESGRIENIINERVICIVIRKI